MARNLGLRNGAPSRVRKRRLRPRTLEGLCLWLGLDRIAMIKYGIPNIKLMFENDIRFLSEF